MLGTTFSHEAIRSYVVAFGTLFNSIQIWRKNSSGIKSQTIDVPLSYAPKEKWLARMNQDPNLDINAGIILPRLSYELVSMVYAPDRKLNTMQRSSVSAPTSNAHSSYAWSPVPYDFFFTLFVYARNNRDASMIVEQILPFFTPEFTVTVREMTDLNINVDVPIILNNINKEETYEGSYDQLRSIVWTLDFTLKGVLYGPVRDSKIIKKAFVDFFIPSSTETITGNAQLGTDGTTSQIRLANTTSAVDNFYVGGTITIIDGTAKTSAGAITAYKGLSKVATVGNNFSVLPDTTSKYSLTYINPLATATNITGDAATTAANAVSRIYTQPGLTSNNTPTSNLSLSIALSDINANDDYGFIQTITIYTPSG